jgi:hypothetical protein
VTTLKPLSTSFVSALRHPRLWLLQFFGNGVIVLLFGWWLNIPVSNGFEVFLNFFLPLLSLVAALLLHAGTLNYYSDISWGDRGAELRSAFKKALKHLPAFAISAALFCLLLYLVDKLDNYQYLFPGYLRSVFPAWLRRHITESGMDELYAGFVGFLGCVVAPGLLLPLGLLCADKGFRGFLMFRAWWHMVRNWAYWMVLILAAFLGVYATGMIMHWLLNSKTATLGAEQVWLAFRLFIAYLLALFSWLWVCAMLARTRPHSEPAPASQKPRPEEFMISDV